MSNDPIVIVGSGLSGYMVAKEFRKLDKTSPLMIVTANDGEYYSKPQLSTALAYKRDAKALSMGDADAMRDQLDADILTQSQVTHIDCQKKTITCANRQIAYSKLVLALGGDKIKLPLSGDGAADVQSVNHLDEYAVFREWLGGKQKITILGSGLVGCEFANDLLHANVSVNVIAPDHYPLARLVPEKIGKALQDALAEQGVRWHFCRFATEVDKTLDGYTVRMENMKEIQADGVFSAAGLRAHMALAKSAGLTVDNGIVVDNYLQTSDPDVFALGDCAQVDGHLFQHIAPILLCARALVKTLVGDRTSVVYPVMPIIVKTPICPIVALPPEKDLAGAWEYEGEGEGQDLVAKFFDIDRKLRGFALSGKAIAQRASLIKMMQVAM